LSLAFTQELFLRGIFLTEPAFRNAFKTIAGGLFRGYRLFGKLADPFKDINRKIIFTIIA
jgi:hypothetical protein